MTTEQAELINKLAGALDCCLEIVADEAKRERRREEGKRLREVTWRDRSEHYPKVVAEARDALTDAGHVVWF